MVLLSPTSASTSEQNSSTIEFRIAGVPGAQGSKVMTRWGSMRESSSKVAPWRNSVMWTTENEYHSSLIIDPVCVEITFFFTRPKSHYGTGRNCTKLKNSAPSHCTSSLHGDIDKLARCTLDGLARRSGGCVLKDDSLVVMLKCSKQYAEANETPGALVRITPIR
jgi:crossover junction endodeoxyribonuclease RusA